MFFASNSSLDQIVQTFHFSDLLDSQSRCVTLKHAACRGIQGCNDQLCTLVFQPLPWDRWHRIPPSGSIYHLYIAFWGYMLLTTFYKNQKQPLISTLDCRVSEYETVFKDMRQQKISTVCSIICMFLGVFGVLQLFCKATLHNFNHLRNDLAKNGWWTHSSSETFTFWDLASWFAKRFNKPKSRWQTYILQLILRMYT